MSPRLRLGLSILVTLAACGDGGREDGSVRIEPRGDAAVPTDDAADPPVDAAPPDAPPPDAAPPDAPPPDAAPPDAAPPDAPPPDAAPPPADAGPPDGPLACVTSSPAVVVTPRISEPVLPDQPTGFDVAITNRDSASCPASTYELHTRTATSGLTPQPPFGVTAIGPPVHGGETAHIAVVATPSRLLEGARGSIVFDLDIEGTFTPFFSGEVEVPVAETAGCHVNIPRELMITDVSVVDDPLRTGWSGPAADPRTGAWTVKRLAEAMAPTSAQAPLMVERMLATFATSQTLNGFTMAPRPQLQTIILDRWPRTADGALDLRAAPLRLLAIVTRIDLRDLAHGDAGEARFVFGFFAEDFPIEATLIFEYKLPAADEGDVLAWAESFHALGALGFSEGYNAALQALTDRFAGRGARPDHPNGSAINAVRTNDISFGDTWELRQFGLSPATGMLVPAPVELTPDVSFNGTDVLARFINDNAAAIIAERHTVPELLAGRPFLAASVVNELAWTAPGILDNEARHHFALNTCNGCHSREAATSFLQIHNRLPGQPALLSRFLTGGTAPDLVSGAPRTFNDLERRRLDLEAIVCPTAAAKLPAVDLRQGIRRVH